MARGSSRKHSTTCQKTFGELVFELFVSAVEVGSSSERLSVYTRDPKSRSPFLEFHPPTSTVWNDRSLRVSESNPRFSSQMVCMGHTSKFPRISCQLFKIPGFHPTHPSTPQGGGYLAPVLRQNILAPTKNTIFRGACGAIHTFWSLY